MRMRKSRKQTRRTKSRKIKGGQSISAIDKISLLNPVIKI